MKSLWVFLCILILSFSTFGIFSAPQKVFAQATPISAGGTYDYFYNETIPLFTNGLAGLRKLLATQQSNQSANNRAIKIESTNAYIKMVTDMQSAYTTSFNDGKSSGLEPAKTQQNALRASYDSYQNTLADMGQKADGSTDARGIVNTVVARQGGIQGLISQADQINSGKIAAGSDKANVLVNADAVTKVADGRAASAANDTECSLFSPTRITPCITEAVTWIIKNTLLQIAGVLLWLGANIFNYSIQIGVLEFAKWAPNALYPIWVIVRQIISLVIVFVGLYLGFLYILGDAQGRFEKYIPWVVMFGLFVNFSYPIARTAIDISNIVSLNIYTSAVGNRALTADPTSSLPFTSGDSAGAIITSRLGLSGLIASATKVDAGGKELLNSANSIPGALMVVAFVLYAAYIFFMVTGIMVMRTIALVFITITSPLLLVDSVLPLLGDKAKQLRQIFFEQLAVGPVFMIMLALTLKFLEVFSSNLGQGADIRGSLSGSGEIVTFFNVLMMLIMLHIMLKVTKSVSGTLGNYATEAMGKVGGFGLGVASGGTGFLARKGIGQLALKARESNWVQTKQDTFMGRRAYNLSNSLANSTFDLRNSKVVAGQMDKVGFGKGLLGMGGMGNGTGSKRSYVQDSKEKTDDILARAKRIPVRHEQDVLKKDENGNVVYDEKGNPVILHRKGDLNKAGVEARERYNQLLGGNRFQTKEEQELIAKELTDASAKDYFDEYGKKKTKVEKESYVGELQAKLEKLKKDDPRGEGAEFKALVRVLDQITDDKKEFSNKVAKAIEKLNSNIPKDKKEEYFSDLDDDIKALIGKTKTPNTIDENGVTKLGKDVYSLKDAPANGNTASSSSSDKNAQAQPNPSAQTRSSTPSPETVPKENTQQNASTSSATAQGKPAPNVPTNEAANSTPFSQGVDIDITQPFDPSTVNAAERFAAKRRAAAERAREEMDNNKGGTTPPEAPVQKAA